MEIVSRYWLCLEQVNFTTTKAGLEGQLLATAIKHEKPELEDRQSQLLEQEENLKLQVRFTPIHSQQVPGSNPGTSKKYFDILLILLSM